VVLGKPINTYPNSLVLLKNLLSRLKKDGHLLLKLHNTYDITSLFKTLGARIDGNIDHVFQLSLDELIDHVNKLGFNHNAIAVENWPLDDKNIQILKNTIRSTEFNQNSAAVFTRAAVRDYVIDIARA